MLFHNQNEAEILSLEQFLEVHVRALPVVIYHCGACGVNLRKTDSGFITCNNVKCGAINEVPER